MDDFSRLFQKALAAHGSGRLNEARDAYRHLVHTAGDRSDAAHMSAEAARLWGLVELQSGSPERAIRCLRFSLSLNPASEDAWHVSGGAARAMGWLEAAIRAYERACAVCSPFPECDFSLGNALSDAERFGRAADAFRRAIAACPDELSYRLGHALALSSAGDHRGSIARARVMIALDPGDNRGRIALGRAEGALGRWSAAVRVLDAALMITPGDETVISERATAKAGAGLIAEAGREYLSLTRSAEAPIRRDAKTRLHNLRVALLVAGDERGAALLSLTDEDGTAVEPSRVRLESSSACNLRCRHCSTGANYGNDARQLMSRELFDRVVAELRSNESLVSCVMYLGGEPLMNPRLASMIRRLRDETTATQIHFVTNAMLVTEGRARDLALSGVEKIYVSIDGRTPEENDDLRLGSRYETVRENVRTLIRHLRPVGVDIYISNVVPRRSDDPETRETPAFLRADFPGVPVTANYAYKWPGWTASDGDAELSVEVRPDRRTGFCSAPFVETVVRARGDVTMCCYDIQGRAVMGRLEEDSLAAIWNGPRYKAVRRAMLAGDADALPAICRDCPVMTGEEIRYPAERGLA